MNTIKFHTSLGKGSLFSEFPVDYVSSNCHASKKAAEGTAEIPRRNLGASGSWLPHGELEQQSIQFHGSCGTCLPLLANHLRNRGHLCDQQVLSACLGTVPYRACTVSMPHNLCDVVTCGTGVVLRGKDWERCAKQRQPGFYPWNLGASNRIQEWWEKMLDFYGVLYLLGGLKMFLLMKGVNFMYLCIYNAYAFQGGTPWFGTLRNLGLQVGDLKFHGRVEGSSASLVLYATAGLIVTSLSRVSFS